MRKYAILFPSAVFSFRICCTFFRIHSYVSRNIFLSFKYFTIFSKISFQVFISSNLIKIFAIFVYNQSFNIASIQFLFLVKNCLIFDTPYATRVTVLPNLSIFYATTCKSANCSINLKPGPHLYANANEACGTEANLNECPTHAKSRSFSIHLVKCKPSTANILFF